MSSSSIPPDLPPLPPGWTRNRVLTTPPEELAALPDEEYALISQYLSANSSSVLSSLIATTAAQTATQNAARVAAGLPTLEDEDAQIAQEMGIVPFDKETQGDLLSIAKTMYSIGAEVFGFVVFKTWGYKTPAERERWDRFWKRWNEVSDSKLRDMGATGDLMEGFAGRLQWVLVEDEEAFDGKGMDDVREVFKEMVEDEENFLNGVDLDLCLVVDKDTVDSLLDGEREEAFVVGLDINGGDEEEDEEEEGESDYPGHFKISMDVLIPELWETLQRQSPDELYPGEDEVFKGITG